MVWPKLVLVINGTQKHVFAEQAHSPVKDPSLNTVGVQ